MPFKVTTWNINSVRLRIDLVARFLKSAQPDVLCLQETKCPDDAFPLKRFKRLGYEHAAVNGQKGYHGVAVISRVPFERIDVQNFCGKIDCRHISVVLGERAGLKDQVTLHNFYVPAGGDEPDPEINPKFQHKLGFLDEMCAHAGLKPEKSDRAILVGDLNVAPLEHDVWSHKQLIRVVSHTSNARNLSPRRTPAAGSTACACIRPNRKNFTRGGATARWATGAPPIAAAGSIMCGRRMRSQARYRQSASPRITAAPSARPTTCR
jgi:exodeoxyribonuclease III